MQRTTTPGTGTTPPAGGGPEPDQRPPRRRSPPRGCRAAASTRPPSATAAARSPCRCWVCPTVAGALKGTAGGQVTPVADAGSRHPGARGAVHARPGAGARRQQGLRGGRPTRAQQLQGRSPARSSTRCSPPPRTCRALTAAGGPTGLLPEVQEQQRSTCSSAPSTSSPTRTRCCGRSGARRAAARAGATGRSRRPLPRAPDRRQRRGGQHVAPAGHLQQRGRQRG